MKELTKVDVLRYYILWKDNEEQFFEKSNNDTRGIFKPETLKKYFSHMQISRNFKPLDGDISSKILDITHELIKEYNSNIPPDCVKILSENLCKKNKALTSRESINNVYVAASKILWLFDENFIIMDNQCLKALNLKEKTSYSDYQEKWRNEYTKHLDKITKLIEEYNMLKIDPIFKAKWFQQRVFDMFLWKYDNN